MQISRFAVICATLFALAPSVGSAQDGRVHLNLGFGPVFTSGDIRDRFPNGWGPAIGVTIDSPNPRVGFQVEYAYRFFDVNDSDRVPGATRFSARHRTHQLNFNIVANFADPYPANTARFYLIAGPGLYYREVAITQYTGTGVICDPYFNVCGTYVDTDVVGSRGGWDVGFNVGGGVAIGLNELFEFYIETRYHYVLGPDIQPNAALPEGAGTGGKANGHYYPMTFGFRF
jgi:hypothetical protein